MADELVGAISQTLQRNSLSRPKPSNREPSAINVPLHRTTGVNKLPRLLSGSPLAKLQVSKKMLLGRINFVKESISTCFSMLLVSNGAFLI